MEKSCRRNAVEVAVLLPVVKAAAKDGKHPFYESRRGLNQGHVFGHVVPARDFPLVVLFLCEVLWSCGLLLAVCCVLCGAVSLLVQTKLLSLL